MLRKLLTVTLAMVVLMTLGATGAQAKPVLAGTYSVGGWKAAIRLYDEPALAHVKDGHCYWGRDNPLDYACTVDKSIDPSTFHVDIPLGDGMMVVNHKEHDFSRSPYFAKQLPYCVPQWFALGKSYHDRSEPNGYFCAFWRQ